MDSWGYTEELRSHLRRGAARRYGGRDHGAGRDVARMLSPWRRGSRYGGSDADFRRE